MTREQAQKKFPSYFENFVMPEWAREQELAVYRACATGKPDRNSFFVPKSRLSVTGKNPFFSEHKYAKKLYINTVMDYITSVTKSLLLVTKLFPDTIYCKLHGEAQSQKFVGFL